MQGPFQSLAFATYSFAGSFFEIISELEPACRFIRTNRLISFFTAHGCLLQNLYESSLSLTRSDAYDCAFAVFRYLHLQQRKGLIMSFPPLLTERQAGAFLRLVDPP